MYIIGASTLGEIIIEVAARAGVLVDGFYDDVTKARTCCGLPVFGKYEDLARNPDARLKGVLIAIGDNKKRSSYADRVRELGVPLRNVIDTRATIESTATIGEGNLIMAGAYIGVKTVVGSGNLIFPGVSITHHNEVGDYCFFSPNCSIGGYTKIGNESKISMNCVVLPYCHIVSGTETEPLTVVSGVPLK